MGKVGYAERKSFIFLLPLHLLGWTSSFIIRLRSPTRSAMNMDWPWGCVFAVADTCPGTGSAGLVTAKHDQQEVSSV
jgi:hypothetical protein